MGHYRHEYLAPTETFIHELIRNHRAYSPEVFTHRLVDSHFPPPARIHMPTGGGGDRLTRALSGSVTLGVRYRRATLGRLLDRQRPHLLHAHFGEDAVVALPAAEALGIPLVATFYGIDATRLLEHWRWGPGIRRVLRQASLLLAEGPHLRKLLIDGGAPPERVRLQPIPIRLDRFPYREPGIQGEETVLLQPCRFVEKKGVDLTLRAFAGLGPEHAAVQLWLIGDGPQRPTLEALASTLGLADRVRFLGMRRHEEYGELMRRADILIHPSRTATNGDTEGGAPTALLEAQAVGLPIVATRHADIPFVVDPEAALLAPEEDVRALTGHLRHLLDHREEWPGRACAGRAKVVEQHDPVRLVKRLEALYDELLGVDRGRIRPALPSGPRVSVVVPTRNRADQVGAAIRSALDQTMPDLEVTVVDDGSTDGSPAELRSLADSDPRVRVLRNAEPEGAAAARNWAIGEARAPLIAFLDDDDRWGARKLERQLPVLESGQADLVHSPFTHVDADGRERVLGKVSAGEHPRRALARGNFIGHSSVVCRRDLLEAVGAFDSRLPRLQDWDLWVRLARVARFRLVPGPLVRIEHSVESISTRPEALGHAARHLLEKVRSDPAVSPGEERDWLFSIGSLLFTNGFVPEGRSMILEAAAGSRRPRRLLSGALALLDPRVFAGAIRGYEALANRVRRSRPSTGPAQ